MAKTYYEILGISPDSPEREIKKAYYGLASKLHPDKAPDPESRKRNEEMLAAVSAAYNVLKDASKRQEYDASLKGQRSTSSGGGRASPSQGSAAPAPVAAAPPAASQSSGSGGAEPSAARAASSGASIKGSELVAQRTGIAERAYVKGMQLFNTRQFAQAVPFFEAAIQNDDTKPHYHLKLAVSLIRSRGSYTRAVEAAQFAIEKDPYNIEYKLVLAEIHETAGAVTAAKKLYEDVLRWEPTNLTAKTQLAALKDKAAGKDGNSFFAGLIRKFSGKK